MTVIVVNTSQTGNPEGWWVMGKEEAEACDYVVEENDGEAVAVYEFTGVSEADKNGRRSFLGFHKVRNPMIYNRIIDYLNEDNKLERVKGEANPVRYYEV